MLAIFDEGIFNVVPPPPQSLPNRPRRSSQLSILAKFILQARQLRLHDQFMAKVVEAVKPVF